MYTPPRANVIMLPSTNQMLFLPHHHVRMTALAIVTKNCACVAFHGVRSVGWSFVNHLGKAPARAIEYHSRVPTRLEAMHTAIVELTSARSTIQYALPQYLSARMSGGRLDASPIAATFLVPQPSSRNHVQ